MRVPNGGMAGPKSTLFCTYPSSEWICFLVGLTRDRQPFDCFFYVPALT